MTLKAQLTEDMKTAMRAKDSVSLSTIRLVNAAIKQYEVDERNEADDARVVAILTKMIKQRKDSAQIYTDAGRGDLADKENAEIDVLNRYMPAMMSADEIQATVAAAIADSGSLTRAGGHYIAGERMRSGAPLVEQALSRQGRYKQVRDNLRVKEIRLDAAPARRPQRHKLPP